MVFFILFLFKGFFMRNVNKFIGAFCLSALAALSSCGADQAKNEKETVSQQAPVASSVATAEATATAELPLMLVAKVPVGADGQELNDLAETREVGSIDAMSESALAAAFDGGNKVVVDELDSDTSVEQFHRRGGRGWYWNTPWYPGKLLGRGLWWGRNPYVFAGGMSHPYRFNNFYNFNGCNYYAYNRYF